MEKYSDIIREHAQIERDKLKKYKKVRELRKEGLSAYEIAKRLELPVHFAKSWIYKNRKPMKRKFE